MAMRLTDVFDPRAGHAQKVDMDADERLIHDMQAGPWQKRMHIGHPPVGGVFDGQHPQINLAVGDFGDDILERGAGNRLHIRA